MPERHLPGPRPVALSIVLAVLTVGCEHDRTPRSVGFDELFEEHDRVILEEPDSAPLTGIESFAPAAHGRFLVVDEGRPQVRVFEHDGSLSRIVGRHGSGPGEFRDPKTAVTDPAGRLFVGDWDGAVITRFTPSFAYDTAFQAPGMGIYEMDWAGDDLLVVLWNEPSEPQDFLVAMMSPEDGSLRSAIHPVDSLTWSIPYWSSFSGPLASAGSARIVTGNTLFYPLHLYTTGGEFIGDFGLEPPSWRQATRPERGEFVGPPGFDRLIRWRRSSTSLTRLGVLDDSLIVAVHAVHDPTAMDLWASKDTLMDIYALDGEKLWTDVPVPGRVMRVEDYVYTLESLPPDPWTVGVYRLNEAR